LFGSIANSVLFIVFDYDKTFSSLFSFISLTWIPFEKEENTVKWEIPSQRRRISIKRNDYPQARNPHNHSHNNPKQHHLLLPQLHLHSNLHCLD